MYPKRIFMVRHGQSEGNVNKHILDTKPDYALELTDLGHKQALERGRELARIIKDGTIQWYVSPYFRTRQTYLGLRQAFKPPYRYYEDPRLREQEWGNLRKGTDYNELESERDLFGHFYYRILLGESCADVWQRCSGVLNTVYRDFRKPWFPENVIFVSHGMTLRVLLARWLHYTVEQFELLANPENCGVFYLELGTDGKYHLIEEPRKYEAPKHPYQFQWPAGGPTGVV